MERRVLLLAGVVFFAVALNGCSTTGKSKDLEMQGLRNQVTALESQSPVKTEETASSDQGAAKNEASATESLDKTDQPTARQIQAALKNAGYYEGVIDGKLGKKTRRAVKEFQKANNLSVDGKVGPKTWTALKEFLQKKIK